MGKIYHCGSLLMLGKCNMENKKIVAIITARGGSKRIPHKNIKEFCGKPIIEYSIIEAQKSGIFDEIMVSTDDYEIAEIAKKAGAKVPFMRSQNTSNDHATTREVLLEVLSKYKEQGKFYDYMVCLYPTNPFISAERLLDAIKLLSEEKCEEVIPVVKFSFPPQRSYILNDDGGLVYKWKEYKDARSQDLEEFYHDAGQFYCYDVNKYLKDNGTIKGKVCPIILSECEVQDIDNEDDWLMAEVKYDYLKKMRHINE